MGILDDMFNMNTAPTQAPNFGPNVPLPPQRPPELGAQNQLVGSGMNPGLQDFLAKYLYGR